MRPNVLAAAVAVFALAAPAAHAAEDWLLPVRRLAVQDGGRTKPLDTFARESARRVTGGRAFGAESVKGLQPTEWVLSMLAEPDRWKDEPIVRVSHAGLREAVGLSATRDKYSFRELAAQEPLLKSVEALQERMQHDESAKLDPTEREISDLYGTLGLMSQLFDGSALRMVPSADPDAAWGSLADLAASKDPAAQRSTVLVQSLLGAYAAGDHSGVGAAANALRARFAESAAGVYPEARTIDREVRYNGLKPFRLAWLLYLVAFLALLASFPTGSRAAALTGIAFAVAAFLIQGYGMTLRTLISGRAPVTNMYESLVFASWGAVLFALLFEAAYRVKYFAVSASGLSVLFLILADALPIFDGSISPLVPVLRDNFWLTTHVITIMLGYAAFLLGVALGHLILGLYFFAPRRRTLLNRLSTFLYRALQAGTLFLAAGTLLGGVWASYSWGRFWGWDPKETWALIALLSYLAILHARFVGWIREFGLAVGALIGGLTVLMAWYGVNYILGTGLHSYGFGSGGYGYVGGFVAFELAVIVGAFLRNRAAIASARAAAVPAGTLASARP